MSERILAATTKRFSLAEQEVHLTASIGIGVYPLDGNDIDSLTKNADSAMYRAKVAGKNCYRFFSEPVSLAV